MLFKARLIVASAAVSVLFVFMLVSCTLRAEQEGDAEGQGIDLDEKLAARYPIKDDPPFDMPWGNYRRLDGTIVKP